MLSPVIEEGLAVPMLQLADKFTKVLVFGGSEDSHPLYLPVLKLALVFPAVFPLEHTNSLLLTIVPIAFIHIPVVEGFSALSVLLTSGVFALIDATVWPLLRALSMHEIVFPATRIAARVFVVEGALPAAQIRHEVAVVPAAFRLAVHPLAEGRVVLPISFIRGAIGPLHGPLTVPHASQPIPAVLGPACICVAAHGWLCFPVKRIFGVQCLGGLFLGEVRGFPYHVRVADLLCADAGK